MAAVTARFSAHDNETKVSGKSCESRQERKKKMPRTDAERVFGNPRRDNWVEVGYPEIRVVMVNRDQLCLPCIVSNAMSSGRHQNSPMKQWLRNSLSQSRVNHCMRVKKTNKVRSPKKSLLKARASMRIIWRTAEGMDNMFESKVELFRVTG